MYSILVTITEGLGVSYNSLCLVLQMDPIEKLTRWLPVCRRRRMLQGLDAAQQLARVSSSSSSAASYDSNQTGTSISLRLNESSRTSDMRSDAERHIDDIFGDPTAANFDGFVPTVRRENVSELFESRLTVSLF